MPTTTRDPHTTTAAADPAGSATEPATGIRPTTAPHTAPTGTPTGAPAADAGGRTAAQDKLWTALHANPLSTADELATAAGIGRSTATKILTRWAANTTVTRTGATSDGGRRTADRWSITQPDATPATTPMAEEPPGDEATTTDTTATVAAQADEQADEPNTDQTSAETVTASESENTTATTPDTEPTAEQPTAEQPTAEQPTAEHGDDHEADTANDSEPGSESDSDSVTYEADRDEFNRDEADRDESADSVGVIQLGNGIALSYPTALLSDPLDGTERGAGGMVELLRLLAAVSLTTKPARRTGPKRSSTPREPGTNHSGTARLPKGALRGMVEDFLAEKPNEEFSPNAIASALGRSSGAVANALDQMVRDGVVTMTSEKPRRYQFAGSE